MGEKRSLIFHKFVYPLIGSNFYFLTTTGSKGSLGKAEPEGELLIQSPDGREKAPNSKLLYGRSWNQFSTVLNFSCVGTVENNVQTCFPADINI